jgi:hypothetical protein
VPKATVFNANFFHALAAVVCGNGVYFALMSHLPLAARHRVDRLDLGLVVDFWFCLVILGVIKTVAHYRRKARAAQR